MALAQTAGMSTHYFSGMFKQSTQVSPHQYVLHSRWQLLYDMDTPITYFEGAGELDLID